MELLKYNYVIIFQLLVYVCMYAKSKFSNLQIKMQPNFLLYCAVTILYTIYICNLQNIVTRDQIVSDTLATSSTTFILLGGGYQVYESCIIMITAYVTVYKCNYITL